MERKLLDFPPQTLSSPISLPAWPFTIRNGCFNGCLIASQWVFNLGWAKENEDLNEVVPILVALMLLRLSFHGQTD